LGPERELERDGLTLAWVLLDTPELSSGCSQGPHLQSGGWKISPCS
jgi:hypothetical protein